MARGVGEKPQMMTCPHRNDHVTNLSGPIPGNLWCSLESSGASSGNANTQSTVGYNPLDGLIRNLRFGLAFIGAGDDGDVWVTQELLLNSGGSAFFVYPTAVGSGKRVPANPS